MTKYIKVAETANILRKALKEAFPCVKFSVRSKSYSMGASIDVSWTDGPTAREVEAITGRFSGATFDGMTDYKGGKVHEFNGEQVHFGADFIFCYRTMSDAFVSKVGQAFEAMPVRERCEIMNKVSPCYSRDGNMAKGVAALTSLCPPKPSPTAEASRVVRTY